MGSDAVAAVNTPEGIVVIDAGISTGLSSRYKKLIEKEFKGKDFIYLIYTHGHSDHFGGSSAFRSAVFIGQENLALEMNKYINNPHKKESLRKIAEDYNQKLKTSADQKEEYFCQKARYLSAYEDQVNKTGFLKPDISFTDTMNLNAGGLSFEMKWLGQYHSLSDIFIYIPQMKILFSGDIFNPYGQGNRSEDTRRDPVQNMLTVKWLNDRINGIQTVISGHGDKYNPDESLKYFLKKLSSDSYDNS